MTLLFDSDGTLVVLSFDIVLRLKKDFLFAPISEAFLAPSHDLTKQSVTIYMYKEEIDAQAILMTVVISILHINNIYYILNMCILMFHSETDPTQQESAKEYQSNLESSFKVGYVAQLCCFFLKKKQNRLNNNNKRHRSDVVFNPIPLHTLQLLEENIMTLVKTELQTLRKSLTLNYAEDAGVQRSEEKLTENREERGEESSRDNIVKVIMNEIRSLGDTGLADCLHNSKNIYI